MQFLMWKDKEFSHNFYPHAIPDFYDLFSSAFFI